MDIREAERQIMLHVIDSKWINHLHSMDSLKEGLIDVEKQVKDIFIRMMRDVETQAQF